MLVWDRVSGGMGACVDVVDGGGEVVVVVVVADGMGWRCGGWVVVVAMRGRLKRMVGELSHMGIVQHL